MKKILKSSAIVLAVAAIAGVATYSYFSDTETSTGNTFTAGVIDIVVDGENPWTKTFTNKLTDMKPSYTRYIEFTVRNLEDSNPVNVWKHIDIKSQTDGVITEPECTEGGGTWTSDSCGGSYVPRNNLAAYIIYDMYVCEDPATQTCATDNEGKPTGENWKTIIGEDQNVRLDNVNSSWIKLGQLNPAKELKVVQSYHLRSWPGAPEPDVTNWAQGDELTFDIELMATQMNAPGPKGVLATLNMDNKNPTTWEPIADNMQGTLTYNTSGNTFNYSFTGSGLQNGTQYSLIYYADPYPGNYPGKLIDTMTTDGSGAVSKAGNVELGMDLPTSPDTNSPGAKIWLVPSNRYNSSTNSIIGWNPTEYLFEMNLIQYEDTNN